MSEDFWHKKNTYQIDKNRAQFLEINIKYFKVLNIKNIILALQVLLLH
jgi:hypothetical protein